MSVIVLQVFVSLILVAGAIVLLACSVRSADYEHADRLSLLPMEHDESPSPTAPSIRPEEASHVE